MIRVGIIGGAGYTAGELIRLLVNHPEAGFAFIHSESNAGRYVHEVHEGLYGDTDLKFCDSFSLEDADVLFLCSGHGKSREFWSRHDRPAGLKVIDLAQDFRDENDGYVYGLPEMQRPKIQGAASIANPGCFATAIQLALLPLAKAGLIGSEVSVTAITGSTGAGVKPSPTTHFSWRSDNISTYKVFEHQHLAEITRNLGLLQPRFQAPVNFVPMRGECAATSRGESSPPHISTARSRKMKPRRSTRTTMPARLSASSATGRSTSSRWSTPTSACSTSRSTAES